MKAANKNCLNHTTSQKHASVLSGKNKYILATKYTNYLFYLTDINFLDISQLCAKFPSLIYHG